MVQDGGDPRLYDTAVINVFVERNMERPNFLPNNNRVVIIIPENSPRGRFIYQLNASDTDRYPPNNEFSFDLSSRFPNSDHDTFFSLIQSMGEIILAKEVLNQTVDQFFLLATVSDKGKPELSNSIQIDVIVERITGLLRFGLQNYTTTIPETQGVGSVILSPRASPGVSIYDKTR